MKLPAIPTESRRPADTAGRRTRGPLHDRRDSARPEPHDHRQAHRRPRGRARRQGARARGGRLGAHRARRARAHRGGGRRAGARRRSPPSRARLSGVVRLSATDGFSGFIAAPAIVAVRRSHPDVSLEIVAAQRRAAQQRVGVDLEVVVGQAARATGPRRCTSPTTRSACTRAARTSNSTATPRIDRPTSMVGRSCTSSSRCCRSTRSTRRAARRDAWSTPSRAPTCSCTSMRRARAPDSACCPPSSPTRTTTSCACSPTRSTSSCPTGWCAGPRRCVSRSCWPSSRRLRARIAEVADDLRGSGGGARRSAAST